MDAHTAATPGFTCIDLADLPKVPLVLNGISARFIRERLVVPLELRQNVLKVVMANPGDRSTIDAIEVATGASLDVLAADPKGLSEYIARFYGQESQNVSKIVEDIGERGPEFIREEEEDVGHLKDLASEAPIIRLVNLLLTRAVEGRASDIHIEPFEDELKIRYRIDGVLHETESTPKKLQRSEERRVGKECRSRWSPYH